MAVTLLEVLVKALKKLKESSFRRFIEKLSDWEVREKYTKIPKDDLTGKDPEHIVGLINSYYREGYGAEVTLDILEDINEKKVREELQQDLMEVDFRRQGLGTPMFTDRINFISHHRSGLIRWIKDVDPVLRDLRDQELVTQEQYIYAMEMRRSQKMKELCDIIRYWADSGKCTAYTVLRKYNEKLIQDLEMEDRMRRSAHSRRFKERINFIDDHRSDLIRWITDVDPLLRDLRDQKLLTQEQCYDMMKKTTNRKKMEELCDVISHWEDIEKYKAYITIRKFNERLIKNLERNDRIWRNAHSERFGDMINFIDHYQSDLIRWLRNVKTVLRDLRDQKLLTQEEYDDVMEKPTNCKKMEELCDVISHWEDAGKYKAYITLRKYNQKIITDWEMEDTVYRNSQSGCFWDHFVNRHRSHLINNIKEVNPVVDDLRTNHFLNEKEYRGLQAVTTPEEKMKHLFYIFWHKCDTVKDQFYISFWRYNYTVIDRLEKSEKLRKISIAEDRVLGENIHRLKKIKQVLHPVIDDLFFESLLTGEECDYMMEMSDMEYWERGLYTIIRDWDEDDKQKVYRSIADNLQTWEESSRLQNGDHLVSDECSKSEQTNKQPDHVMGMSQSKDKMLRLYCIISGFNDKEEFFRTLYKHSRSVTNNLKMLGDESKLQEAKSQESETSMMGNTGVKEDDLSCKLCDQSQGSGKVITPTLIHSTYRLSMTSPGLFRCSESGIQFQVTQPVTIEYEVDSWSNYTEILQNLHGGYEIIGPLFNIRSTLEPNVVTAVYLPHCLCLGGFKGAKSLIKCFHYKDDNLVLESPSKIEAMYAVLENPTFSCIGVILYPLNCLKDGIMKLLPCHGMVLLFYNTITRDDLTYKYRLHLYLLPNIRTVEKEVEREEARHSCQRIYKPPQTESVYSKKKYRINGPPIASVIPKTLLFESDRLCKLYSYIEIKINGEKNTEVNVSVHPEDKDITVWEAMVSAEEMLDVPSEMSKSTIQPGGLQHLPEENDHFVDKHRAYLIRKISDIAPVLDTLEELHLLTHEQCETVSHQKTNPEKMRKLYDYMKGWGNDDKDKVYQALGEHNQPTIEHLENLCRSALT